MTFRGRNGFSGDSPRINYKSLTSSPTTLGFQLGAWGALRLTAFFPCRQSKFFAYVFQREAFFDLPSDLVTFLARFGSFSPHPSWVLVRLLPATWFSVSLSKFAVAMGCSQRLGSVSPHPSLPFSAELEKYVHFLPIQLRLPLENTQPTRST